MLELTLIDTLKYLDHKNIVLDNQRKVPVIIIYYVWTTERQVYCES
jgi:hypothetical protein